MDQNIVWAIIIVAVVGFMVMRSRGSISPDKARAFLKAGAVVIDVRTSGEFSQGHLRKAVNVPLQELPSRIAKVVPNRETPVLLHCASGARSASAAGALRRMGYVSARNIGSLGRARSIIEG